MAAKNGAIAQQDATHAGETTRSCADPDCPPFLTAAESICWGALFRGPKKFSHRCIVLMAMRLQRFVLLAFCMFGLLRAGLGSGLEHVAQDNECLDGYGQEQQQLHRTQAAARSAWAGRRFRLCLPGVAYCLGRDRWSTALRLRVWFGLRKAG
jgi:hypothetical protein